MSVALAPAVALAPVVAEGRPYLLAQAAGCLAWPATALAMVATELPRAPRVYKEMAMECTTRNHLFYDGTISS